MQQSKTEPLLLLATCVFMSLFLFRQPLRLPESVAVGALVLGLAFVLWLRRVQKRRIRTRAAEGSAAAPSPDAQRKRFWFLFVVAVVGAVTPMAISHTLALWIRVTAPMFAIGMFLVIWRFRPKV